MIQKSRFFLVCLTLFFLVMQFELTSAAVSNSEPVGSSKKATSTSAPRKARQPKKIKVAKHKRSTKQARIKSTVKPRVVVAQADSLPDSDLRRRISARSAIIMDAKTGETLYAHSPDLPGQPASTLKVLTGLLAINSLKGTEMVEVSHRAALMPSSKVNLQPGKNYRANDLINAVLLASANDASVALAEKIAGSENDFARLMTAKARTLGATNTECKTASGLTAQGQKSTARDLATIFRSAMQERSFAERMAMITCKTSDGKVLRNHNKALWRMDCAEGGKTGYTQAARQTYVGKFSRDDKDLIVALLGSETMWKDIRNLVNYGFTLSRKQDSRIAAAKPKKPVAQSEKNKDSDDTILVGQQAHVELSKDNKVSKL
jgi:D-alanyl-D-alanine carboxypeptidase (penicillin-binding protein 5/6)